MTLTDELTAQLAAREKELRAELEKAAQQINDLQALAQRIQGALAFIEELRQKPIDTEAKNV